MKLSAVADEEFERAASQRENPFAVLGKLKTAKYLGKS